MTSSGPYGMNDLLVGGFVGDFYAVFEEYATEDDIITVGDGQWADEDVVIFLDAEAATEHVLQVIEGAHLDQVLTQGSELEGASLSIVPSRIDDCGVMMDAEYVVVSLTRKEGWEVSLSDEAVNELPAQMVDRLQAVDGRSFSNVAKRR